MDCVYKNELGTITMANEVIAMVAGCACLDCFGIVAMGTKRATDGIVEIFKRENLSKGVKVAVNDNNITVTLSIIVEYGVSISAVAKTVMENVKYHVENMTGMSVAKVNVSIEGIRVQGQ